MTNDLLFAQASGESLELLLRDLRDREIDHFPDGPDTLSSNHGSNRLLPSGRPQFSSNRQGAGDACRSPTRPRPRTAPIGFGGHRHVWWHLFAKKRPRPGFYVSNEDGIPAHSRHVVPSVCQCTRLAGNGSARDRPPKLAGCRIEDLAHSRARRRALGCGDATHQTGQARHRKRTCDSPSCRHGVHLTRLRPPPAGHIERKAEPVGWGHVAPSGARSSRSRSGRLAHTPPSACPATGRSALHAVPYRVRSRDGGVPSLCPMVVSPFT